MSLFKKSMGWTIRKFWSSSANKRSRIIYTDIFFCYRIRYLKQLTNANKKLAKNKYPVRRVGRRSFIRLRICPARDSTKAILPSLLWGAPVSIDFKLSVSARQAVSNELSDAPLPDCAEAIETDWPIRATHGISEVFGGPWFNRRACTAERAFGSEAAWSILLITPTVLVAAMEKHQN